MFGPCTDPLLRVKGIDISFAQQGLTLALGESVQIDTKERTILLNGDPPSHEYEGTNFTAWSWADLPLKPGANRIRFGAATLGTDAKALFRWRKWTMSPWPPAALADELDRPSVGTVKCAGRGTKERSWNGS